MARWQLWCLMQRLLRCGSDRGRVASCRVHLRGDAFDQTDGAQERSQSSAAREKGKEQKLTLLEFGCAVNLYAGYVPRSRPPTLLLLLFIIPPPSAVEV